MFDFDLFVYDLKIYCLKNKIVFDDLPIYAQNRVIKKMLKKITKSFNKNCKGGYHV